ncbi:hypothetical protein BKE38_22800 [Pseudoroseomonas deserti]|uniref:Uncharacterized protein n=1 Tax=Teichococcus deserti TaxID=1817963 RepID=A0A1V2GWN4_9PROT|nr:hypothetical protein [Pseudoroseomonas deserti]ONG47725.1 hypothetical protein BKE38_22800 [Pseudoroseomonas deserti]
MTDLPPAPPSGRLRRWALTADDAAAGPVAPGSFGPELSLDTLPDDQSRSGTGSGAVTLAPPRPATPDQAGLANAPADKLRQGASLPNPNARAPVTQGAGLANSRSAAPAAPALPPPVPLNGIPAEPRQPPLLREHRVLLFHPTLLCQALHHCGRDRLRLPIEDVTGAEMLTDSQSVRFRFGPGGRSGEVVVNTPGLGATLIAYCIGAGIPIPASAAKSLQVTEQGVKLELRLTLTTAPYFRPRGSSEW